SRCGTTYNVTVLFSPAARVIRWKPFSSITGRVTRLTSARRYNWTTSSPARDPVFVTSTDTLVRPSGVICAGERVGVEYVNVVYERPWPNGKRGSLDSNR